MGNRNKQSVLCAVMQVLISWTGSISAQTVERSPRYARSNVGCVHVVGIYGGLCFDVQDVREELTEAATLTGGRDGAGFVRLIGSSAKKKGCHLCMH